MPVDVKPLFDKIMKDPDVIPEEGQEKKRFGYVYGFTTGYTGREQ